MSYFFHLHLYEYVPLVIINLLDAFKIITNGLALVLTILYGIFLVLKEILSGGWIWGSSRTNSMLFVLTLNTLVLVFLTK